MDKKTTDQIKAAETGRRDEITDEMMEAGLTVLEAAGLLDDARAVGKHVVSEIFEAMFESRPPGSWV